MNTQRLFAAISLIVSTAARPLQRASVPRPAWGPPGRWRRLVTRHRPYAEPVKPLEPGQAVERLEPLLICLTPRGTWLMRWFHSKPGAGDIVAEIRRGRLIDCLLSTAVYDPSERQCFKNHKNETPCASGMRW